MSPRTTRLLHAVHKWTGLIVGLNVLFLSVTGAWLVFMLEIQRVFPAEVGELLGQVAMHGDTPVQAALDILKTQIPEARPMVVYRPRHEQDALHVGCSNGKRYRLDTQTGELRLTDLGTATKFNALIFTLHANLYMATAGAIFVGCIGVLFCISTLTGLCIYGAFMKGAVVNLLRWDRGLRRGTADLHKLVGSTSLAFNLLIGVTGVVLAFGMTLERQWMQREIAALGSTGQALPEGTPLPPVDVVIQRTLDMQPGQTFYSLSFPGSLQGPGNYLVFNDSHGVFGTHAPVIGLIPVDLSTPSVVNIPLWAKAVLFCIPFHYGDFAGLGLKIVYALFGLASGALSISGAILSFSAWAKRWRARKRRATGEFAA